MSYRPAQSDNHAANVEMAFTAMRKNRFDTVCELERSSCALLSPGIGFVSGSSSNFPTSAGAKTRRRKSHQRLLVATEQPTCGNICVLNMSFEICDHISVRREVGALETTRSNSSVARLATSSCFASQFGLGCFQLCKFGLQILFTLRAPNHPI